MSKVTKIEGLPIKDARKALHVIVSPQDVKDGAKKKASSCAAALCLTRSCGFDAARVHLSRVYVKKGKKWLRYVTPQSMRSQIIAFDNGGEFEAGEYTLRKVNTHDLAENRTAKRRANPRSGTKNRGIRKNHMVAGVRERFR